MNKMDKNKIKTNIKNLSNTNINFHKINSIMNKNLVGLVDYLTASVYFSHYNDKKKQTEKNLENFFKSNIFSKRPFIFKNNSKLNNKNDQKKQNKQLNIIMDIKNNQINFKKTKFTSPYILHSKKSHFMKNMVVFSKHIHSEAKKEDDIKKKYPKLESKSLSSYDLKNLSGNTIILTPRTSRVNSSLISNRFDRFTSTRDFNNKNIKSTHDTNLDNVSSFIFTNKFLMSGNNKFKNSDSYLSLESNKESEIIQWKKRLKLKVRNLYDKNLEDYTKTSKNSNISFDTKIINNRNNNYQSLTNRTSKMFRTLKPNCYYNNLHLLKLAKTFKKNSYQNLE